MYVRGEWHWLSHKTDCSTDRAGSGVGLIWNDPTEPGYNVGLLEQEPHDTMLLFGLGNELFSLGQYTEAIPYFEEAVRVDPEYAAVYVYLARAYEESNQPDMVRQTLERGWGPAVRSGDRNLIAEIEDIRERL